MWRLVIDDISEMQPELLYKTPTKEKASITNWGENKKDQFGSLKKECKYKDQAFAPAAFNRKKGKGVANI